MKITRNYALVLVIVVLAAILLPHLRLLLEGERGRVKRVIYAAKRATENEDSFACISFVSTQYDDEYGNGRQNLFAIAKNFFDYYDDIAISIRSLDISVENDAAEAKIEALITVRRSPRTRDNVIEYDTIKMIVYFKKESAGWKVVKIDLIETDLILPQSVT